MLTNYHLSWWFHFIGITKSYAELKYLVWIPRKYVSDLFISISIWIFRNSFSRYFLQDIWKNFGIMYSITFPWILAKYFRRKCCWPLSHTKNIDWFFYKHRSHGKLLPVCSVAIANPEQCHRSRERDVPGLLIRHAVCRIDTEPGLETDFLRCEFRKNRVEEKLFGAYEEPY